jgi:hypothetical protein
VRRQGLRCSHPLLWISQEVEWTSGSWVELSRLFCFKNTVGEFLMKLSVRVDFCAFVGKLRTPSFRHFNLAKHSASELRSSSTRLHLSELA